MKYTKKLLDSCLYQMLVIEVSGNEAFNNPFPSLEIINLNLARLSPLQYKIIQFFLLGNGLLKQEATLLLSSEVITELEENNLVVEDELFIRLDGYCLSAMHGKYFFSNKPYYYLNAKNKKDDVYIGPDSFKMVNMIPKIGGMQGLDLCTGTGIQAMFLSEYTNQIDAVDINENSVRLANINAKLNNIKNINFICGDLYENIKGKEYDYIVSNPPFIPFVKEQNFYSIAGAAGIDGLQIINEILCEIDNYIKNEGLLLIYAEGLSKKGVLLVESSIKRFLSNNYIVDITVFNQISSDEYLLRISELCKNSYNEDSSTIIKQLKKYFSENEITSYHSYLMIGRKLNGNEKTIINVTKNYLDIDENTKFKINVNPNNLKFVKNPETYNMFYKNKLIAGVDLEMKQLIEKREFNITAEERLNSPKKLNSLSKLELSRIIIREEE